MFADGALEAARFACGQLGWTADVFWAATPAEIVTALEGRFGRETTQLAALGAADLDQLKRRFPDG